MRVLPDLSNPTDSRGQVSNAGGELGKVAGIEHGNETSLGQQQDVSFPPLPPAGNSSQVHHASTNPIFKSIAAYPLTPGWLLKLNPPPPPPPLLVQCAAQTAWRQGPEESEKQALFVLEALEHAQNSSGQVPKERFGSYGSHMSAGSPEAPSPLNSATEMVALWYVDNQQLVLLCT